MQNEGKHCAEFVNYIKRSEGNTENVPVFQCAPFTGHTPGTAIGKQQRQLTKAMLPEYERLGAGNKEQILASIAL